MLVLQIFDCTIFEVIIFQDFAAPSLQNGAFSLQTGRSGQPVLMQFQQMDNTLRLQTSLSLRSYCYGFIKAK